MSCIVGAIMYCTASIVIPGPVGYASSGPSNAWSYAAYYGPVVLQQPGVTLPAYANRNPIIFQTIGAAPYHAPPRGPYGRS